MQIANAFCTVLGLRQSDKMFALSAVVKYVPVFSCVAIAEPNGGDADARLE